MLLEDFKNIANVLIDEVTDFLELASALKEFKSKLLALTEVDLKQNSNRENIHFNDGKALGTSWAIMCIDDLLRTKKFVKGLYEAIKNLRQKQDRVHILYAGTGPFATLALPIMALFSSSDVQFTMLEINPISIQHLKKVIQSLHLQDYIYKVDHDNATSYTIDTSFKIDILLTETMQHALIREQQVPISYQLINQLEEDVVLIPEKIELELCLVDSKKQHTYSMGESREPYHKTIGSFFELSRDSILNSKSLDIDFNKPYNFPISEFRLPNNFDNFARLAVLTNITIYRNTKLLLGESGLTIPLMLSELNKSHADKDIAINYHVSEIPKIVFNIQ